MPAVALEVQAAARPRAIRLAFRDDALRVAPRCRTVVLMVAMIAMPVPVSAQMQITNVSDVSFGTITNVSADVSQSQTVCAYSGLFSGRYNITATGSGAAGAFTLTNGAATLAYDVQWNALAGQTSGTMLSTGAALTGLLSYAVLPTCTLGVTPSGTLTITLRSAALSSAAAGNFTGTLSLMISPN